MYQNISIKRLLEYICNVVESVKGGSCPSHGFILISEYWLIAGATSTIIRFWKCI